LDARESERLAETEFQDWILDRVEGDAQKGWSISWQGVGFWVQPGSPIVPRVGMRARLYGKGFGYAVHGLELDGVVVYYKTAAERAAEAAEFKRAYDEEDARRQAESFIPPEQPAGFEWTEGTRQISGFGGGYERACRSMVSAGCKWWSEHPEARPEFHGFKGITGVVIEDNEDAKALSQAITSAADGASGAMHQAAVNHCFAWKRLGSWQAYQAEMRRLLDEESEVDA
jgi:hypothetical protein